MQTSLIELNLACDDVIFSLSDNFLSDGKHAWPMDPSDNLNFTRSGQSPGRPHADIPSWIKPTLWWRHFFSIGWFLSDWKHACPMDPSDNLTFRTLGQSPGRAHTDIPNWIKRSLWDVIFSPSDNFLSNGKHACPMDPSNNLTFTRLVQSPCRPHADIPNWIKPTLWWRHFWSDGSIGQSKGPRVSIFYA